MTVSANNDAVDIKALVYALTQQREPLPQTVQRSLQEVGRDLQQAQPTAANRLRACIESYPPLATDYKDAIREIDRQYLSQERTKSISASFDDSPGLDWFFVNKVIPAADWVATAKQAFKTLPSASTKDQGTDKITRIGIAAMGGACIGVWIAQLPGGIVGGLAGLAYGWWYTGSYEKKSSRSPR